MNIMAMRWGKLYRGTPAELALEDAVAALGVPYRTQFPGYLYGFRFFPDFVLPTLGVVIEVDDGSHNRPDKRLADAERSEQLQERQGWRVVRCTNQEALSDPRGTVKRLMGCLGLWPVPTDLPRLVDCMPATRKCPKKDKRAAKSAATQKRRQRSIEPQPTETE